MKIGFSDVQNKEDRNFAIINSYLDGYSQVDIASYLKLSKSLISKVVKSGDSLTVGVRPWVLDVIHISSIC